MFFSPPAGGLLPHLPSPILFKNSFTELLFTFHAIHLFKVYNLMAFSVFTGSAVVTMVNFRTFSSPQRDPISFHSPVILPTPPPPPFPKQLLIYFLSL